MDTKVKKIQRDRRRKRIRAKVFGTSDKPRFSIFRSNRYISAQLIDDTKGATLVSASTKDSKAKSTKAKATEVGKKIAELAKTKGIEKVVFDRGGYLYSGSVSAIADGAREAGLKF